MHGVFGIALIIRVEEETHSFNRFIVTPAKILTTSFLPSASVMPFSAKIFFAA